MLSNQIETIKHVFFFFFSSSGEFWWFALRVAVGRESILFFKVCGLLAEKLTCSIPDARK